jgi:signal transduction histidine kinase
VVRLYTQREFSKLVVNQNQQVLLSNLERYYVVNQSWAGVETVFIPGGWDAAPQTRPADGPWEVRRNLFIITDASGTVVFGKSPEHGAQISSSEFANGTPITVEKEVVGLLFFTPNLGRWDPGTPEGNFLLGVQNAIWISVIAAIGIALLLGGFLAFTLTRSLRELTAATQELSKGKLGLQVEVRSRDELGFLAESFNQMSTDLARSVELRRKMTADIAHDLRTPLSVILGYTEALSDGKLKADSEMYAVMHTEARHLSHLVDDLKVLALAEAGELPLNIQPIDARRLLVRLAEVHRVQADQAQIAIVTAIPDELPEIQADVERMAQVLGNLMSNALRYTPEGGTITLSARVLVGNVLLELADNGTGIPPDDLPYIFDRSFRGDKASRQKNGETGLGLAIARSLVEAQGGKIQVESQVGQGTKFSIVMPRS